MLNRFIASIKRHINYWCVYVVMNIITLIVYIDRRGYVQDMYSKSQVHSTHDIGANVCISRGPSDAYCNLQVIRDTRRGYDFVAFHFYTSRQSRTIRTLKTGTRSSVGNRKQFRQHVRVRLYCVEDDGERRPPQRVVGREENMLGGVTSSGGRRRIRRRNLGHRRRVQGYLFFTLRPWKISARVDYTGSGWVGRGGRRTFSTVV